METSRSKIHPYHKAKEPIPSPSNVNAKNGSKIHYQGFILLKGKMRKSAL
jgi:hypothetical protein